MIFKGFYGVWWVDLIGIFLFFIIYVFIYCFFSESNCIVTGEECLCFGIKWLIYLVFSM